MRAALATLLLLGFTASAQTVWTWTGADGEVHYTDDPGTIPPGVKAQSTQGEPLGVLEVGPGASAPKASPPPPPPPPPPASAAPRPGPGEEARWRKDFRAARESVALLEARVAQDRAALEVNGLPITAQNQCRRTVRTVGGVVTAWGPCVPRPDALTRAKLKLEQDEKALQVARQALEDLERRASEQAVPRAWRS
ncbi:MAG: DUF4124 domain-containing protein [Myxococcaceae bacterium]|nr:DUF4124 domain-containing protein [Myxococcaceae bacterium]